MLKSFKYIVKQYWIEILSDGTSDYRSGEELRPGLPGTLCEASKVLEEIIEA